MIEDTLNYIEGYVWTFLSVMSFVIPTFAIPGFGQVVMVPLSILFSFFVVIVQFIGSYQLYTEVF